MMDGRKMHVHTSSLNDYEMIISDRLIGKYTHKKREAAPHLSSSALISLICVSSVSRDFYHCPKQREVHLLLIPSFVQLFSSLYNFRILQPAAFKLFYFPSFPVPCTFSQTSASFPS